MLAHSMQGVGEYAGNDKVRHLHNYTRMGWALRTRQCQAGIQIPFMKIDNSVIIEPSLSLLPQG